MSNPQTFYTVGGVDLSNIFQPISLGNPSIVLTKYNLINNDLNAIFAALPNSTAPGVQTSYYVTGQGDLGNIFYTKIPFLITGSTNYIRGTLSNYYNVLYFRPGTFTVTPLINVNIYQLFVVASGSSGIGRDGGNGGQLVFNENTTIGANPISVSPSNIISLTVAAAYNGAGTTTGNNSSASISGTGINYIALGGGGAFGGQCPNSGGRAVQDGSANIYTGLYYGGGGGASGGSKEPGLIGGKGGGGGGGGSYNGQGSGGPAFNGAAGGGNGVNTGGAGGAGATSANTNGVAGTSSQYGGGGGGGSRGNGYTGAIGGNGGTGGGNAGGGGQYNTAIGGSGGGGGGGGYYGGGGGAGGQGGGTGLAQASGGGGGAGVIILIYKFL
jgi:hypothetical protein